MISYGEKQGSFSYESLQIATDYFSNHLLIGEGGSARVYRGILPNGLQVAVKKYWPERVLISSEINLKKMVWVMSQIQHRNVHRTLGCCTDNDHLLVVSEYAEKGSLNCMLRHESSFSFLNWNTRAAICVGIARGLSYLHEDVNPRVIHRDIKSANILLDNNFTPKITDFEQVNLFSDSNELPLEGIVVGTLGYLDPEYFRTSQYTDKVDVYSFGVLMLEIISGRTVYFQCSKEEEEKQHIAPWASRLVKKDRILEIVDPVLTDLPTDDAQRFIDVALLCVQLDSNLRPSMQEVVHMLYGVCNSSRLSITRPDLSLIDDQTNANIYQDSSTQGSTATTGLKDEEEGESSILQEEGPKSVVATKVEGGVIDVRAHVADLITALNNILRIQGVEVSIVREHTETEAKETKRVEGNNSILQDRGVEFAAASRETAFHDTIVSMVKDILNTEGVESSKAQEHKQQKKMKPGVVLSGSGDLEKKQSQSMVFKKHPKNDCPEAVYPPFRTRVFQPLGSRNLKHSQNDFPEAVYPPFRTRVFRRFGSRNLYPF